jgi:hypothetical protein
VLPFSGFYYSVHDQELDEVLNQMFSDRDTGCDVNEDLVMRAWDKMDWRQVHIDYAKEYVDDFSREFKLDLEFDELNSPREYNFTTDRVFAYITTESLQKVFNTVDTPALRVKIHENHTSRDGFISFYTNTLESWPADVTEWDPNQIGTLLQAFVEQESTNDWDQYEEYNLMEDTRGNGYLDEILWRNCPEMARLTKVHEYLEHRAKREEVMA